jgi:CubicO group peptidase (beta-lactamase class C family)
MMKTFPAALLTAALMLAGCGREEPVTSDTPSEGQATRAKLVDPAALSSTLSSFVESGALIGASALVYERGEEVFFGAYGLADREAQRPMQRDTLVRIYSMTKPITGVALMTLYDEGKFQLDDPLAKYAPEFANLRVYAGTDAQGQAIYEAPKRAPTIRDVMRHTAGFSSGKDDTSPVGEMYRAADPTNLKNTLTEMAKRIGSVPLLYQPGTRWLYGPSVDVQAFLVERLSREPFDAFVQKRIFDPLRMTNTRYTLREEDRAKLAMIYQRSDDGAFTPFTDDDGVRINEKKWPLTPGGWGFVSTLDDYMRFARMLLNDGELDGARVLSAEAVELMRTNAMPAEVTDTSWLPSKGQVGFGIDFAVRIAPPANSEEASGAVGEFFWDGYANTLFWVDPANDIAAVLFTQYIPFGKVPLHKAFRDAVYAKDPVASALATNGGQRSDVMTE